MLGDVADLQRRNVVRGCMAEVIWVYLYNGVVRLWDP